VRSEAEIPRAEAALQLAELPYERLQPIAMRLGSKEAWESLNSDTSVPFAKPSTGCIAVKVINHLRYEVMKVYRVSG
jgi:adenine-specific DNA-methyltransferase